MESKCNREDGRIAENHQGLHRGSTPNEKVDEQHQIYIQVTRANTVQPRTPVPTPINERCARNCYKPTNQEYTQ